MIDHRAQAERIIQNAMDSQGRLVVERGTAEVLALAQVHATLAAAHPAAPAAPAGVDPQQHAAVVAELTALRRVVAAHIWDAETRPSGEFSEAAKRLKAAITHAGASLGGELDALVAAEIEAGREEALVAELAAAVTASEAGTAEYRTLGEIVRSHPAANGMTEKQLDSLMQQVHEAARKD